jgi:hypothetical protein
MNYKCLRCGNCQNPCRVTAHAKPMPSDIVICMSCAYLMGFNPDMSYRVLTPKEKVRVLSKRQNQDLIHSIKTLIERGNYHE